MWRLCKHSGDCGRSMVANARVAIAHFVFLGRPNISGAIDDRGRKAGHRQPRRSLYACSAALPRRLQLDFVLGAN